MKVELSPRAIADLDSIREYLVSRSPQGAENVRRAIADTIAILEQFPGAGRASTIQGVRIILVFRYDYVIYHTLSSNKVSILHIRHGARDVPLPSEI